MSRAARSYRARSFPPVACASTLRSILVIVTGVLVSGPPCVSGLLAGSPLCGEARGEQGPGRATATVTAPGAPLLGVVRQARTGSQPKSVYVSPDGTRIYVCNFGRPDQDNIRIYNAESLAPVGTIEFEGNCVELAFSPDGRTLYASNFRRGVVEVIDVASRSVRGEVEVGRTPKTIEVSADGATLFVANYFSRSVSVVDARRLVETGRIRTGDLPRGMALSRDGRLFVAAFGDQVIHEFDTRRGNREVRRIATCRLPRSLALSNDGTQLYVSCSCCRMVQWHDLSDGSVAGQARVGHNPRTLDTSADGRWIAVADFDSSTVSLIDTVMGRHRTSRVPGSDQIVGVAVRPGPSLRVYATSWNNNRLFALAATE